MGDAGRELADRRQFFRLGQLGLGVRQPDIEFGQFGVAPPQLGLGDFPAATSSASCWLVAANWAVCSATRFSSFVLVLAQFIRRPVSFGNVLEGLDRPDDAPFAITQEPR